jgi:hypothetical protein
MENKNWRQKIIEVIKKRDSRFWLMIFVVISTLSIMSIWIMDVRNVFSGGNSWNEELSLIKPDNNNNQLDSALGDLANFLENIPVEEESDSENILGTSSSENIDDNDLSKIVEAINLKLSEQGDENIAVSDIKNKTEETSSSSDPILSLDLDASDQSSVELKKIIEELEKRLGE